MKTLLGRPQRGGEDGPFATGRGGERSVGFAVASRGFSVLTAPVGDVRLLSNVLALVRPRCAAHLARRGLKPRPADARLRRLLGALVGAWLLGSLNSAYALQGGEDPSELPVLIHKNHGQRGRHQLSLAVSASLAPKFVEGRGLFGAYQYNLSDFLGFELSGAYFFASETDIMDAVRRLREDQLALSDLHQLVASVSLDVVVVPIYGKISYASEFNPGFDLFALAGVGAAATRRQLGPSEEGRSRSKLVMSFNVGAGMRLYLTRFMALRFELREVFYPEPDEGHGGLTWNFFAQAGLQFALGGAQ